MEKISVYRGFNEVEFPHTYGFFSSSPKFASDFGRTVKHYTLHVNRLFDSAKVGDVQELLDAVGVLEDPYDNRLYASAQEFVDACGGCDTWETIDQHMLTIRNMGYDTVRVYEGGYKNYIAFNLNQAESS